MPPVAILLILFSLLAVPGTKAGSKQDVISYRLPGHSLPIRYDIEINTRIDEASFNFFGKVKIRLQVLVQGRDITLHAKQLTIVDVELRDSGGMTIGIQTPTVDPVTNFLTITTQGVELMAGAEYTLDVQYQGILRTDNLGFYRSSYVNEAGVTEWLAITQFAAGEARHAFPCYDEPGIRAVYGLTLNHGRRYHALGNMPIKSRSDFGLDLAKTVFEDTPSMQAYLVAFVVSNFAMVSNAATKEPDELLHTVYGQPDRVGQGDAAVALVMGQHIMKALEQHLGLKYSLPKMDQVAVPNFYWNAMENFGLVTYKETRLYYNETTSPTSQLQSMANIISHEFAHQWFGNRVAPQWWEFVWLNEGFATFYEYKGANLVYPGWRIIDLMVVSSCQTVRERDAYDATRPMNFYVEDPDSVLKIFDFVAYGKAGCVLRMVEHALSASTFQRGIHSYLDEKEFGVATPDDLYRNLDVAAQAEAALPTGTTVKLVMDTWANQKGYPVITISRFGTSGNIAVTQKPFMLDSPQDSAPRKWWIPLNFATQSLPDFNDTKPHTWMPVDFEQVIADIRLPTDAWIIFNKQATGYYRVNYEDRLWELITDELVRGDLAKIHVLNRAQLLDDSFSIARSGDIKFDVPLALLEYLSKEMDYVPWVPADRAFTLLDQRMAALSDYPNFLTFVRNAVSPLFYKLGVANIDDEPYFDRLARNVAIKWACYAGSRQCLETTLRLVEEHIDGTNLIKPDTRSTVLCAGLHTADERLFGKVWDLMNGTSNTNEKGVLIDALACSQNDLLLLNFLNSVMNPANPYTSAEKTRVFAQVANSGHLGAKTVLNFVDQTVLHEIELGASISNMANWITDVVEYQKTIVLLYDLLIAKKITQMEFDRLKLVLASNSEWVNDRHAEVGAFLSDYMKRNGGTSTSVTLALVLFSLIVSIVI